VLKYVSNFDMQLFYLPELEKNSQIAAFSKEESKHIFKVLRKKVGDLLSITNGKNLLFSGKIKSISKSNCEVQILNCIEENELDYSLHIAISCLKSNERFEWFLEKASEIGITEISPLICDRSERKFINEKRLKKVLVSAMKQSLKTHLPVLNQLTRLKDFMKRKSDDQLFIAHCNDSIKNPLLKSVKPKSKITILIGPEGDFTESEVEEALKAGFKPVSLGNSRFRAETAAIIASHTVSITNM